MKNLVALAFCFLTMSFTFWNSGFEKATQVAKEQHKLILLNFSGSDWCGPCMRMRKEIFESAAFSVLADSALILINADFPRNKKNQLAANLKKENEALADKYNPGGVFPFTVLLDPEGNVLQSWEGLPKENTTDFTLQLKVICDAHK